MDINRELAELLGLCWHEYIPKSEDEWATMVCSKCRKETNNLDAQFPNVIPVYDFGSDSGKIELLRLMMKREDWPEFISTVGKYSIISGEPEEPFDPWIRLDYILDTTGLLAQAARDFLKGQNKFKQIETEEAQSIR
jgi:hypothetical protein